MRERAIRLVGLAGAIVLLGTGTAAAAKTTDPCQLLTTAKITKVLGQPAGPAVEGEPNPVLRQCYWEVPATGTLPPGEVGTVIASGAQATAAYEVNSQRPTAKPVPGIKKAFFDSALSTISVLRGDVLMNVQALFFPDASGLSDKPHYKEILKLTKIALKRLG